MTNPPNSEPIITEPDRPVRCEDCNDTGVVRTWEHRPINGRTSNGHPVNSVHMVSRLHRCHCGQGWSTKA